MVKIDRESLVKVLTQMIEEHNNKEKNEENTSDEEDVMAIEKKKNEKQKKSDKADYCYKNYNRYIKQLQKSSINYQKKIPEFIDDAIDYEKKCAILKNSNTGGDRARCISIMIDEFYDVKHKYLIHKYCGPLIDFLAEL